jgi:hypothetical protein
MCVDLKRFLSPQQSVQTLIKDFSGDKPLYKAAHIFFLESEFANLSVSFPGPPHNRAHRPEINLPFSAECSTSLFSKLGANKVSKREC